MKLLNGSTAALLVPLLAVACGGGAEPAQHGGSGVSGTGVPGRDLPPTSGSGTGGAQPGDAPAGGAATNTEPPPSSEDVAKGEHALSAGDAAGAKAAFQAGVKKNPKDPLAHYYLGVVAEQEGDKATAEAEYKSALAIRSDLEPAAVNLGAIYIDSNRLAEAATTTRQALTSHSKSASLHVNLALVLAAQGDAAGSEGEFDQASKIAPNDPMVQLTFGHWLGVWKRPDDAAARLRGARGLTKELGVIAGIGHEMRLVGAFPDCIATYDMAIAQKDAAELRTERALCKLGAKDPAGAEKDLTAALAADAKYAPAHFYLGGRYAEAKRWADAAKEYETYSKLEPSGPLAKQAADRAKAAHDRDKKK